jgi:hypothetical protein
MGIGPIEPEPALDRLALGPSSLSVKLQQASHMICNACFEKQQPSSIFRSPLSPQMSPPADVRPQKRCAARSVRNVHSLANHREGVRRAQ